MTNKPTHLLSKMIGTNRIQFCNGRASDGINFTNKADEVTCKSCIKAMSKKPLPASAVVPEGHDFHGQLVKTLKRHEDRKVVPFHSNNKERTGFLGYTSEGLASYRTPAVAVETKMTNPQGVEIAPTMTAKQVFDVAANNPSIPLEVHASRMGLNAAGRFRMWSALRHAVLGSPEGGPLSDWLTTATNAQLGDAYRKAALLAK